MLPSTMSHVTINDGWSASALDGSCTTHCSSLGQTCSDSTLQARNSEVDSSAEVVAIITSLGYSTTGPCIAQADANKPQFRPSSRTYSSSSKTASQYDCAAIAGNNRRRLGYCDGGSSPPPSPPPPSPPPMQPPSAPPSSPPMIPPSQPPLLPKLLRCGLRHLRM